MREKVRTSSAAPAARRDASATPSQQAPSSLANPIGNAAGAPLPAPSRAFFEPRLGTDFSQVRVHADAQSDATAQTLDAHAYTVGNHIGFARGAFAPESDHGRRLLAHELTHVAQQRRGGQPAAWVSEPGDAAEREADAFASGAALASSAVPFIPRAQPTARISRDGTGAKKKFSRDDRVIAKVPFALMDKLGGEAGQKKIKQVAKGDLLKVQGEPANGGGLAFTVVVMKSETEEALDASGQRQVGVASTAWLAPAPALPKAPPAPTGPPQLDLPKAATEMEFDLGEDEEGSITLESLPVAQKANYVDRKTRVVAFSALTAFFGGYSIFVEGFDKGILIPEGYVDRAARTATPISQHVYADRDEALAAVAAAGGGDRIAYYQATAGLIVPTVFSMATTPRIVTMINANWKEFADEMNAVLTIFAVQLLGTIFGNIAIRVTAGDRTKLPPRLVTDADPAAPPANKPPAQPSEVTPRAPARPRSVSEEHPSMPSRPRAGADTGEAPAPRRPVSPTNPGGGPKPAFSRRGDRLPMGQGANEPANPAPKPAAPTHPALRVEPVAGQNRWRAMDAAVGQEVGSAYYDSDGNLRMSINTENQGMRTNKMTGTQIHDALLLASGGSKAPFRAEWRPALPNNLETFNGSLLQGKGEAAAASSTFTGKLCAQRGLTEPRVVPGGKRNAPGTVVNVRDAQGKPLPPQTDTAGITYESVDVIFAPAPPSAAK